MDWECTRSRVGSHSTTENAQSSLAALVCNCCVKTKPNSRLSMKFEPLSLHQGPVHSDLYNVRAQYLFIFKKDSFLHGVFAR